MHRKFFARIRGPGWTAVFFLAMIFALGLIGPLTAEANNPARGNHDAVLSWVADYTTNHAEVMAMGQDSGKDTKGTSALMKTDVTPMTWAYGHGAVILAQSATDTTQSPRVVTAVEKTSYYTHKVTLISSTWAVHQRPDLVLGLLNVNADEQPYLLVVAVKLAVKQKTFFYFYAVMNSNMQDPGVSYAKVASEALGDTSFLIGHNMACPDGANHHVLRL